MESVPRAVATGSNRNSGVINLTQYFLSWFENTGRHRSQYSLARGAVSKLPRAIIRFDRAENVNPNHALSFPGTRSAYPRP